jgi:hypothetical protein
VIPDPIPTNNLKGFYEDFLIPKLLKEAITNYHRKW